MTVRITVRETTPRLVVRVEGRLTAHEIGELEGVLGGHPTRTELELADLRSADAVALGVLRRLRADGVALRGVPPRLAYDLDE